MNNLNIALFGNGNTGSEVAKLIDDQNLIGPFTSKKIATITELEKADVARVFVPGIAMESIIPQLLKAKIHAVIGATGFEWPKTINNQLKEKT